MPRMSTRSGAGTDGEAEQDPLSQNETMDTKLQV